MRLYVLYHDTILAVDTRTFGVVATRLRHIRGGYNYWRKPGAFNNGFFGYASTLVFSMSRSSGSDLISLGAQESTRMPDRFSTVSRCSFWTFAVLRLLSSFITGLEAPYTDLRLLSTSWSLDVVASPISIAMTGIGTTQTGLKFLEVAVLLTQVSGVLSSIFGVSRAITSLARQDQAPRLFTLNDPSGRPTLSLGLATFTAFLGFVTVSELSSVVFAWLVGISGIPVLFIQISIFVAHIRFNVSRLNKRYSTGTMGSWVGISFSRLLPSNSGRALAKQDFLTFCL